MKTVRLAIVVAGYAATAHRLWQRHGDTVMGALRRSPDLPASPYPSAGASASAPPANPPGPVDPELIAPAPAV